MGSDYPVPKIKSGREVMMLKLMILGVRVGVS